MTKLIIYFGKELDENTVNPSDDIAAALRQIAKKVKLGASCDIAKGFMWSVDKEC